MAHCARAPHLHLGFPVWRSGGSFIQLSKEVDMRTDRLAEVVKRALLVGMLQLGYIGLA
ncbi:sulfate transporter subunit, partial [Sinorhizobium meliloti]